MQLYLPLIIAIVVIALMSRRMMRPRRFRLAFVWIGPVMILAGATAFFASHRAPTPTHVAGLTLALLIGYALGWLRAKLVKVAFDPRTNIVTQRGTPYGLLLLVGLFVARAGVRVATVQHPEWGIDLAHATDILILFGLGIVSGYAVELYFAVGRARRTAA
jgi:hypothetical protein